MFPSFNLTTGGRRFLGRAAGFGRANPGHRNGAVKEGAAGHFAATVAPIAALTATPAMMRLRRRPRRLARNSANCADGTVSAGGLKNAALCRRQSLKTWQEDLAPH